MVLCFHWWLVLIVDAMRLCCGFVLIFVSLISTPDNNYSISKIGSTSSREKNLKNAARLLNCSFPRLRCLRTTESSMNNFLLNNNFSRFGYNNFEFSLYGTSIYYFNITTTSSILFYSALARLCGGSSSTSRSCWGAAAVGSLSFSFSPPPPSDNVAIRSSISLQKVKRFVSSSVRIVRP